jgi:tRNA 2-selenouridine synthase
MKTCNFSEYLKDYKSLPIIDVRSNGEFEQGHIPNAINFPLLNNEERSIVGLCYKQNGHKEAVIKGFELVGSKFANYLRSVETIISSKDVIVHCWRGGLRSNIMSWLLEKGGYNPILLVGGYKSYRNWVQKSFETERKLIVLGGKTGSHKTKLLQKLRSKNQSIIDLENLANHRGSAFGGIGLGPQPTQEQFENNLAHELYPFDSNEIIWFENESRLVGKCIIPDFLLNKIRVAPLVNIEVNRELRVKNIIEEYGSYDKKLLIEKTLEIEKKLGNLNMRNAVSYLLDNNYFSWANLLLDYYDKGYEHSKIRQNRSIVVSIEYTETTDVEELVKVKEKIIS